MRGFAFLVPFDGRYECGRRGPGKMTLRRSQDFLDNFAIIDGWALEAAVVEVGQFDVIQSQQVQNGGMDVVHVCPSR